MTVKGHSRSLVMTLFDCDKQEAQLSQRDRACYWIFC